MASSYPTPFYTLLVNSVSPRFPHPLLQPTCVQHTIQNPSFSSGAVFFCKIFFVGCGRRRRTLPHGTKTYGAPVDEINGSTKLTFGPGRTIFTITISGGGGRKKKEEEEERTSGGMRQRATAVLCGRYLRHPLAKKLSTRRLQLQL